MAARKGQTADCSTAGRGIWLGREIEASKFGLDRFVQILHLYAKSHWLGVSTTADFKAAIEAAAAQDLPGFDPTSYWSTWRVD